MKRLECLSLLGPLIKDDDLVVTTLGWVAGEWFAVRHKESNLYQVNMGMADDTKPNETSLALLNAKMDSLAREVGALDRDDPKRADLVKEIFSLERIGGGDEKRGEITGSDFDDSTILLSRSIFRLAVSFAGTRSLSPSLSRPQDSQFVKV